MDLPENKSLGLQGVTPEASAGPEPAVPEMAEGSGEEELPGDNQLFFNVMPQPKKADNIISPSVNVVNSSASAAGSGMGAAQKKMKLYGIIAAVLAVLGIAGYFLVPKLIKQDLGDDVVVPAGVDLQKEDEGDANTTPESALTQEWLVKFFEKDVCEDQTICGEQADPDQDGYLNLEEFKQGTDPNNADSDRDGLADGDEVRIFSSDPLNANSANDPKYTDADFLKGGYSISRPDSMLTDQERQEIGQKMKDSGLHQPTFATLQGVLAKLYGFTAETGAGQSETASSTPAGLDDALKGVDRSPEAIQDRDAQRYTTTKNLSISLVRYFEDKRKYPTVATLSEMVAAIKPYNRVATNPVDPIDKDPYVYSYSGEGEGADFVLSYFSETQNQLIKIRAKDALKYKAAEDAKLFDDQRISNLELIRSALLIYSGAHIAGSQDYVFPTVEKYKTELVPSYMSSIPKDPQTGKDYEYTVSEKFDAFTLKAVLSNPPAGYTGYLCNQEECRNY